MYMSSLVITDESKEKDSFFCMSVPGSSNQDRYKHWILNEGNIRIFLIADGHGIRGEKYAESCISVFDQVIPTIDWDKDDLQEDFESIFSNIDLYCKENVDILFGGSTLSICVMRKDRDIVVANVGDSDVIMFDKETKTSTYFSTEHSSNNLEEFKRIIVDYPETRFCYDRVRKQRRYPIIDMFVKNDDGEYVPNKKPTTNCYYKNVRNDLASKICLTGFELKHITVSRSIGDFFHKEKMGLISKPTVSKFPPLTENQFIICASDGFWDCWKFEEIFTEFIENNETWESKHSSHTKSLFGRSHDDMSCYFIY